MDPFVVMVLSIGFIISVVALHSEYCRSSFPSHNADLFTLQSSQRSRRGSHHKRLQCGAFDGCKSSAFDVTWRAEAKCHAGTYNIPVAFDCDLHHQISQRLSVKRGLRRSALSKGIVQSQQPYSQVPRCCGSHLSVHCQDHGQPTRRRLRCRRADAESACIAFAVTGDARPNPARCS